jgi:hypothetical protein
MKKLLAVAALGLAALGPTADQASAWWPRDGCSYYKYNITIYSTPYNAFTPCGCVNPLGIPWGNWGQGGCCPQGYCGQGFGDCPQPDQPWCAGPDGCLGPVDVLGPSAPNCVKAAFGVGDRHRHDPWWSCLGLGKTGDTGCAGGCDGGADGDKGRRHRLFHHREPEAPANNWGPAYIDAEDGCPHDGSWDGATVAPPPAQSTPAPAQKQAVTPTPDNGAANLTTIEMDPVTNAWPMPR